MFPSSTVLIFIFRIFMNVFVLITIVSSFIFIFIAFQVSPFPCFTSIFIFLIFTSSSSLPSSFPSTHHCLHSYHHQFSTFITVFIHCFQPHLLSYFPLIHYLLCYLKSLSCLYFLIFTRFCLHTLNHCPHHHQ